MESSTTGSKSFSWDDVDWRALRKLRGRFLDFDGEGGAADAADAHADRSDYWTSPSALESYDFTFGERIGWKWDAVLAELQARGWTPPRGTALDWGCGTGVAGRRVVEAWPGAVEKLLLGDRSYGAVQFALRRAREIFPTTVVALSTAGAGADLLIVSHVVNELSPGAMEELVAAMEKAQAVLWVEPGTFLASRKVISVRERLRGKFAVIAPCTHALECGMLAAGNERHWCHHFAKVPGYAHLDSGWSRFAATLEIDLGTLPYSWLVLDRRAGAVRPEAEWSRLIGVPRFYKGYAKILDCQGDGVRELTLQKRDAPELFKSLKKEPGSLYRWVREGEKIRDGKRAC